MMDGQALDKQTDTDSLSSPLRLRMSRKLDARTVKPGGGKGARTSKPGGGRGRQKGVECEEE
jgi:hypothetical protein